MKRTTEIVAILFAIALPGSAVLLPCEAQELPAAVASDLVDDALSKELAGVAGVPSPPARVAVVARTLSIVSATIGVVTLVVGWNRVEPKPRPGRPRGAEPAGEAGTGPDEGESEGDREGHEGSGNDEMDEQERVARRERLRRIREKRKTAAPLVLPPHVTAALERAARRQADEALAARGADQADPDPSPPSEGLDYVVPAYDPWKGES